MADLYAVSDRVKPTAVPQLQARALSTGAGSCLSVPDSQGLRKGAHKCYGKAVKSGNFPLSKQKAVIFLTASSNPRESRSCITQTIRVYLCQVLKRCITTGKQALWQQSLRSHPTPFLPHILVFEAPSSLFQFLTYFMQQLCCWHNLPLQS